MLANALKQARARNKWSLEDVAKHSGLSKSTLSRLENGEPIKSFKVLVQVCDAYGLELWEQFYNWVVSQGAELPPPVVEHIHSACGQAEPEDTLREDLVAEYAYTRQIRRDRHMAEAYHEITKILAKLSQKSHYTVRTDAVVMDANSAVSDARMRSFMGSSMKNRTVFATRYPVKFAFEIHHFPPRKVGWHCAPSGVSSPAGTECFTVISGDGVLLIRESDGDWKEHLLGPGTVGTYRADVDHVWINTSRDTTLVASAASYGFTYSLTDQVISQHTTNPKRQLGGRALEYDLDDLPKNFPCERLAPLVERIAASQ